MAPFALEAKEEDGKVQYVGSFAHIVSLNTSAMSIVRMSYLLTYLEGCSAGDPERTMGDLLEMFQMKCD